MKNGLLFFFCFAFFGAFAQNESSKFSIAVEAGGNYGVVSPISSFTSPKYLLGYDFSIVPKYQITPKISGSLRIQGSKKGFSTEPFWIAYRVDYLTVNPQIDFRLFNFIEISGGGYLSNRLGHSTKYVQTEEWRSDGGIDISQNDFGFTIQTKIYLSKMYLYGSFAKGYKEMSVCGLVDTGSNDCTSPPNEFFRSFHFGIGYVFMER